MGLAASWPRAGAWLGKGLGWLALLTLALLIAWLPLSWALALVGGGGLFLLILARPTYAVFLLIVAVPFGGLREISIGPAAISVTDFLVAVLLLGWAARLLAMGPARVRLTPLLLPFLLFLATMILATTPAPSLLLSAKEILKWLEFLIVYLFAANMLGAREVRLAMLLLLATAAAEALVGWYQFFFRVGPPSFVLAGRFLRAYGTFGQPNPFAGYLNLVLPLGLALSWAWVRGRDPKELGSLCSLLILGSTGVMLAALVMSFSRAAWLALLAAGIVILALWGRRLWGLLLAGGITVLLLFFLGLSALLPTVVVERFAQMGASFRFFDVRTVKATDDNWAIVERMANWQAAWQMVSDHPWEGIGLGNFGVVYPSYAFGGWREVPTAHAHNYYLNLLAETGIPGLGGYLVFLLTAFGYTWGALREVPHRAAARRAWARAVVLGVLGVLTALSVHNLFDNLYVHSMAVQLGLLLGMVAALRGGDGAGRRAPAGKAPR